MFILSSVLPLRSRITPRRVSRDVTGANERHCHHMSSLASIDLLEQGLENSQLGDAGSMYVYV